MRISAVFILLLILTSCFSELDQDIEHRRFNENQVVVFDDIPPLEDTVPSYSMSEEAIVFQLDSVKIYIDSLEGYIDSTSISTDTLRMDLELGSTIESRLIQIQPQDSVEVIVLQRFETSITIQNEGPHCDMIEWKHFISDWDTLAPLNDSLFYRAIEYTSDASNSFPEFTVAEIKKAVKKHCGSDWAKLLADIKEPLDYPVSIGISHIQLKIIFRDMRDDSILEKIIIFSIPMGC